MLFKISMIKIEIGLSFNKLEDFIFYTKNTQNKKIKIKISFQLNGKISSSSNLDFYLYEGKECMRLIVISLSPHQKEYSNLQDNLDTFKHVFSLSY